MRILLVVALFTACGAESPAGKPNGGGCVPDGQYPNAGCQGGVCVDLRIPGNAQGQTGICTELCHAPTGCSYGGVCVAGWHGLVICRQPCQSDGDCKDGFVCYPSGAVGPGTVKSCWATCTGDPTRAAPDCA